MINDKLLLLGLGIGNKAVKKHLDYANINYRVYDENTSYDDCCILIKSSGIKPTNKVVEEFNDKKYLVLSDLGLYSLLKKDSFDIGVTGSNGKTTTCTLINNLLSLQYETSLCGNIGDPIFNHINNSHHIIECSSYMLDNCYKFKPNIFVILNIKPHHLDYHKSYINYIKAKIKCMKNMTSDSYIIYNEDDVLLKKIVETYDVRKVSFSKINNNSIAYLKGNKIYYNKDVYIELDLSNLLFCDDIMASIIVAKILKIEDEKIKFVISNFTSLEHRFEIIHKKENLIIINDSKATNPEATLKAFESTFIQFPDFQTLWIGGGKMCNENYTILKDYIKKINYVFLYGENRKYLYKVLNLQKVNCLLFPNLNDVIECIFSLKLERKLILFSPASPSFDQYLNFEERGKSFKELIKKSVII